MRIITRKRLFGGGSVAAIALLAAGCASGPAAETSAPDAPAPDAHGHDVEAGSRVAVSLEGEVAVLDAETLSVIDTFETEEFTRLNAVGDGQNVLVTTSAGFQVLDTTGPELTETVFDADAAGHVVRHAGQTILYSDGWGETTIFDSHALVDSDGAMPEVRQHQADAPHHGVSIVLEDGTLVTTVGDDAARSGAVALEPHDDHYHELAVSDQCPGIHGEGTAKDEAVVFGCEDGALMYRDGAFHKFDAPDEYGRMGNAYVSETSPIAVGDYKNDPDDEGYLLNDVALIDTENETYAVQNLGDVEYTWRGAGRGPGDRFFVLGTDGSIHVMGPESGEFDDAYPVVDEWEGPGDWQQPHPAMITAGDIAYVADVANQRVVSVDLTTGEVLAEGESLSSAPNEIAVNLD